MKVLTYLVGWRYSHNWKCVSKPSQVTHCFSPWNAFSLGKENCTLLKLLAENLGSWCVDGQTYATPWILLFTGWYLHTIQRRQGQLLPFHAHEAGSLACCDPVLQTKQSHLCAMALPYTWDSVTCALWPCHTRDMRPSNICRVTCVLDHLYGRMPWPCYTHETGSLVCCNPAINMMQGQLWPCHGHESGSLVCCDPAIHVMQGQLWPCHTHEAG